MPNKIKFDGVFALHQVQLEAPNKNLIVLTTNLTIIVQCVEMWQIGIYNNFREQIQLLIRIEKGWTHEFVRNSTYD